MAEKENNAELDAIAERIFAARMAGIQLRGAEVEALDSYRHAEAFLAARAKVRGGALKVKPGDETPELADCWAPNKPITSPWNLLSQQCGNLDHVNRIRKWLDRNPTPEREPLDLVARFNSEHRDLGLAWDLQDVNVARALFPAYAKR